MTTPSGQEIINNLKPYIRELVGADERDAAVVAAAARAVAAAEAAEAAVNTPGRKGDDGLTPRIQEGTWWIGDHDTEVPAQGPPGEGGETITLVEDPPGSGLFVIGA